MLQVLHDLLTFFSLFKDFCFTVIVAVFWLSASAAWANGVVSLKNATGESWLLTSELSPCKKTGDVFSRGIQYCEHTSDGSFGGANASIVSI